MRLTERYMDPPGQARPDCLIAAGLAQALGRSFSAAGDAERPAAFDGFDWRPRKTPSWTATTPMPAAASYVTYDRLRAMGTNGFQEPATGLDGETICRTKRLYT